jgi:primosomal protein N' (replication factor Y)
VSKVAREAFARIEALDAREFPMPMAELARLAGLKGVGAIRALVRAGVLAEHDEERVRARRSALDVDGRGEDAGASGGASGDASGGVRGAVRSTAPVLTDEQRACVEAIDAEGSGEHLVFGVTGSGKTEVYLALIERVLARGRDAIVLVPEIALTPQTQGRFVARFGPSRVAVLHSGLTAAQRHEEWLRCLGGGSGGEMVVVGARSAVFAPVGRLGLIVIDEEHDGSYKQDRSPRYLALDVARERVRRAGVGLVLGSATPALERWARATRTPRSRLHRLTVRATGAPMPRVVVVDMKEERRRRMAGDAREAARVHVLGPTLERALETTLGEGGQAILLLNRRGFAHYVACPKAACGFILGCDSCDARLVLHKGRELPVGSVVKCHHCLAERLVPRVCPDCGGPLVTWGAGTQRAEEELSRKFASMGLVEGETLLRLDADTMGRASEYFAALERFGSGRARVLLGTQMIAKGLDFPGVRLVGVLDADTSMSLPDFRAAERTYQLVSQVAGRAGRVGAGGIVIVQTWTPEAAAIRHAATHDYVGFAEAEMLVRKRAGLPPFTRMARIVSRDERERVAQERGRVAAEAVRAGAAARGVTVRVRGPVPCAIARIADRYRYGVEVVATSLADLHAALDHAWNAGALTNDEAMAIDVDPLSLV